MLKLLPQVPSYSSNVENDKRKAKKGKCLCEASREGEVKKTGH